MSENEVTTRECKEKSRKDITTSIDKKINEKDKELFRLRLIIFTVLCIFIMYLNELPPQLVIFVISLTFALIVDNFDNLRVTFVELFLDLVYGQNKS